MGQILTSLEVALELMTHIISDAGLTVMVLKGGRS